MTPRAELQDQAHIAVENVGGIDETAVTFDPGVTLLVGRNATNRTSLLQAVMAACGSEAVSLKADADEAHVELTIGEETYTRHLHRHEDTVSFEGDPYLDDPEVADLFAFLLGTNEARRAVDRSDELRELVMRPVDTDAIQAEIDRLTEKRREVESDLDDLDGLQDRLPGLEERRARLDEEIDDLRDDLEETRAELERTEADVESTREDEAELEERLEELREKRSALEDVRYDVQTEEEVIESLREEREDLQAALGELPDPADERASELETEIERLRERKRTLETEIDELQSVIQFNERMLDEEGDTVVQALTSDGPVGGAGPADEDPNGEVPAEDRGGPRGGDGTGESDPGNNASVTDRLLEGESTTCWTCGSEVAVEEIRSTLDRLRDVNQSRFSRVDEIETELSEYQSAVREIQERRERREEVQRRLSELEADLETRTRRIDDLDERRGELDEEIATLESEVESLEETVQTEVLSLHKEANELEFEIDKLERERADVDGEITEIEDRLDGREDLEDEREEIQAEIEDFRTKIERLDRQVIEEFNDHMSTILDLLEYENVERIWLERVETTTREGRRTVTKPAFELHVIRSTESGTTYEDTIHHLSESEREVTGLVFALAGYLAHEVHEEVPFMLLDSLDPIDADRIAMLVEYLTDVADYLVVALLEEDAAPFDESARRITDI